MPPLEWDGRSDAVLQAFGENGARFMEYVHDHGTFPDVPLAQMLAAWRHHYPGFREDRWPRPEDGRGG